jgi:predicted SAM-dependent methyltransferase
MNADVDDHHRGPDSLDNASLYLCCRGSGARLHLSHLRLPDVKALEDYRYRTRLHRLQRAYYDGDGKDNGVIVEYLRVLAEAREAELARERDPQRTIAVHIGSGGHYIRGWINIDLDPQPPVDVASDLSAAIPMRSDSVHYIHSEDFLEHIDLEAGVLFLRESFRVLRRGGVMRLLTPDLRALIHEVYLARDARHIRWCNAHLGAKGPCESLNMHLRMNGDHRFLYDEERLREILEEIGFKVRRVRYNRSAHRRLRFLDLRDFGLNLFLECSKP